MNKMFNVKDKEKQHAIEKSINHFASDDRIFDSRAS
jgi:hypothetical protein